MTKEEYFGEWLKVIPQKELQQVVKNLNIIYHQKQCTPLYKDIFKAFNVTPYDELKVIILGESPYIKETIATGIAYSNNSVKLSSSLEILKEAIINYEVPHNIYTFDSSFRQICKQGVLCINRALTTELNKPNSHILLWNNFIKKFLVKLSYSNPGLIFLLIGKSRELKRYISSNNHIIECKSILDYKKHPIELRSKLEELNRLVKYYYSTEIKWYNEDKI